MAHFKLSKTKIIVSLAIILVAAIAISGWSFYGYYVSSKKEITALCKEYLRTTETGYVLPQKYQNKSVKVPDTVIAKYKTDIKNKLTSLCSTKNPELLKREVSVLNKLLDDQGKKEWIFYSEQFKIIDSATTLGNKSDDYYADSFTAKITIYTWFKDKTWRKGDVEAASSASGNWKYEFGLTRENNRWKIASCEPDMY